MLKKLLVVMSLSSMTLLFSDQITDLIQTNVSPLEVGNIFETNKTTFVFKPLKINTKKCEVEFNGDLDLLKNDFKDQIETIWENIKGDSTYFTNELKNKAMQEALIKIPTYMDFMYQKQTPEILAKIGEEMSLCVSKTVAKGAELAIGGGVGDQGGTAKVGVKPKEIMGVLECYQEAWYPTNMTNDDVILLNQIEKKWKGIISALLYGQLNIMLESFTVERNNNVCKNVTTKKQDNLAYLVDMLENQKIVLLNNKNIKASVLFEIKKEVDDQSKVETNTDVAEVTEVNLENDKVATQSLFIDMEPASFEVFKEDVRVYMVTLVKNYGLYLNAETVNFLQEKIIDQIFYDSYVGNNNLSSDLQTLLMSLSKSPEFFYNRYEDTASGLEMLDDKDYVNARIDIVKEVLNKTLLYTYSKGEYIREQKLKVYYANVQQFIQVKNRFLLQILLLDRYMFRYKEKVNNAIVNNIITKKTIEKELYFKDFCLQNRQELYDDLCKRS